MKPVIRVIGVGSPYGDDQVGWWVIEALRQLGLPDGIDTCALDRPGPALLNRVTDVEQLVLVDAADFGGAAGSWQKTTAAELLAHASDNVAGVTGSHELGLLDTLRLAQACQISLPPTQVYLVQLASVEQITADVKHAADEVAAAIKAEIG